jgi:hypothetical protein
MVYKSRKYRKSINNKKLHENKIQFLNIGSTNTIIKNNDTVTNSTIDWSGNYNGKVADIHVSVDDNGRKEVMDIKLDNNDLTKLLGIPSINKQLDQRLMDDFYVRDQPQLYQQYYNNIDNIDNNNNSQLVDIMDSLKFRKANGNKSLKINNKSNKNKNRNRNRNAKRNTKRNKK